MTSADFSDEVIRLFPAIADDVAGDRELLHVVMGHLYHYSQDQLSACQWAELDRVFRLLDEAFATSRSSSEIENAIRVSFLEYFEFQEHEERVRQLLGPSLTLLYEDQLRYMEDLARRAADVRAAPDAGDPPP